MKWLHQSEEWVKGLCCSPWETKLPQCRAQLGALLGSGIPGSTHSAGLQWNLLRETATCQDVIQSAETQSNVQATSPVCHSWLLEVIPMSWGAGDFHKIPVSALKLKYPMAFRNIDQLPVAGGKITAQPPKFLCFHLTWPHEHLLATCAILAGVSSTRTWPSARSHCITSIPHSSHQVPQGLDGTKVCSFGQDNVGSALLCGTSPWSFAVTHICTALPCCKAEGQPPPSDFPTDRAHRMKSQPCWKCDQDFRRNVATNTFVLQSKQIKWQHYTSGEQEAFDDIGSNFLTY